MYKLLLIINFILVILCIFLILIIFNYRKRISQSISLINKYKESINRDYQKDSQYLNQIIEEKTEYLNNSIIPYVSKQNKIITDDDLNKIITSAVIDIKRNISEPYEDLLRFYINDLDVFIGSRLKSILEPQFVKNNVSVLKNGSSIYSGFLEKEENSKH